MEAEVIKKRAEEILKFLLETMVPTSINGHKFDSGYSVEARPACINIHLYMLFQPNSSLYDGRWDFNYGEMIPLHYLSDESGMKMFETDKLIVIIDMVSSAITAIIDMDKRFPVEPKFESRWLMRPYNEKGEPLL